MWDCAVAAGAVVGVDDGVAPGADVVAALVAGDGVDGDAGPGVAWVIGPTHLGNYKIAAHDVAAWSRVNYLL